MAQIKRETLRKRVRKSLVEQLEAKGADIDLFTDQINDYMYLWDLKEMLQEDIKENGLRLAYRTAAGNLTQKDNPSVKSITTVNKQMLTLLRHLGVSTDNAVKGGISIDDL